MDLRIGMRADESRYVYDRKKISEDIEVYAEDFVCPPEAIIADGFTNAKAARDYIRKLEGKPIITWKSGKQSDGEPEHRMCADGTHVASVYNTGDREDPNWEIWDVVKNKFVDDGFGSKADAQEAAEDFRMSRWRTRNETEIVPRSARAHRRHSHCGGHPRSCSRGRLLWLAYRRRLIRCRQCCNPLRQVLKISSRRSC
jgi:hypothetical protein